jgi:hypothetical protein
MMLPVAIALQLQHGFGRDEQQLHSDFLIDRLSTEDFQRLRTATVMLFLSDDELDSSSSGDGDGPRGGGGSSSSSRWSVVFPNARGGTWRGTAEPKDAWPNLSTGQQVCTVKMPAKETQRPQRRAHPALPFCNCARCPGLAYSDRFSW